MHPDRLFDWRKFHADEHPAPVVVDSRRRLRICLAGFLAAAGLVVGRVVQLQVTQGRALCEEASKPLTRLEVLPGVRGRILASSGEVLACDRQVLCLAVHYRYLEEPINPAWLRQMARSRLSRAQRGRPERVAAAEAEVRAERAQTTRRLAEVCGLSASQWTARARQIQSRVQRIAEQVRSTPHAPREDARHAERDEYNSCGGIAKRICNAIVETLKASMNEPPPGRMPVAEEREYHVMAEDLPLATVARIEAHPELYPDTKIVERRRRTYPGGRLAAHVLGHLGPADAAELAGGAYDPDDRPGRMGLERRYESLLHGRRGLALETTDHSGRLLGTSRQREPGVGRDLVLTLDPKLQAAAETLLDAALQRRSLGASPPEPAGGAIVVMDVRDGSIRASASAPAFSPGVFAGGQGGPPAALLDDPAHPLFDRVLKMAIPPGSVFKIVTAAALLESARGKGDRSNLCEAPSGPFRQIGPVPFSGLDPEEIYICHGYLDSPDRWRCAIYQRYGVGHGPVTLADALAVSCNVYFFHHARLLGPEPLVDWAGRCGFGRTTGVDLPGESPGALPTPQNIRGVEGRAWRTADTQSLAIGQGSLEATPLQVARLLAAVANGGQLVTPHVVSGLGLPASDDEQPAWLTGKDRLAPAATPAADDAIRVPAPRPIDGLEARTLAAIRRGLEQAVSDPRGTAHAALNLESIAVAGKTGTAQAGPGRAEHAWFAGYVPAGEPRLALVVVLEHAGNADETAAPVARRLVLEMDKLGYFRRVP
jgi:penicillin-binding protein 2